jgi:phage major head subunit gpT-like protein
MAVMTSGDIAKALWPGVNAWYGKTYNEFPVEYTQIFETYKSNKAYEEDVGLSGLGLFVVKPEGSPIQYDKERQGFTTRYTHINYALGFMVTQEAFDDDQYGVVAPAKAKGLGFSIRQTKEILAANVINRAFNTTYTGGDGATLVASAGSGGSASHPNVSGGTWTNGPAAAVDMSEAALEQAVIDIENFTNDRGLKIAVTPKALLIPVSMQFDASRILKSDGRVGTDLNDMNVLKTMGSIPKIIVNHYLTDTDAWFILTNAQEGLKYWERKGDSFDIDNDFDTKNAKFAATFRCSFGWTDPRCIWGSPGL